jgi:putative phosphotransacetylase
MNIPVVVHHRHVHLSQKDMDALFGRPLTPESELGHKGQVVYRETVSVLGKHGMLENVRVLGPSREATQLELSPVEMAALGLDAPVRVSGDLSKCESVRLRGPAGEIRRACAIIPARHMHVNDTDAQRLHVKHGDVITLVSKKGTRVEHVTVRVHPTFSLECHLTPDEAAELWLSTGDILHLASDASDAL